MEIILSIEQYLEKHTLHQKIVNKKSLVITTLRNIYKVDFGLFFSMFSVSIDMINKKSIFYFKCETLLISFNRKYQRGIVDNYWARKIMSEREL